MVYCDNNRSIKHWGSEEVVIRYRNLLTQVHTITFPDFFVVTEKGKYLIEIKTEATIEKMGEIVKAQSILK